MAGIDPTYIADHVARAKVSTRGQFHASSKLQALLAALTTEVQRAEDVSYTMLIDRLLDNAEGVNLDRIGDWVVLPRLDVSDDDEYRELLRVKIRANRSDCGAEDVIYVASELVGADVLYRQEGTLHFRLQYVSDQSLTDDWLARVVAMLSDVACSATTWRMVEGSDTDAFRYNDGPGYGSGEYGRLVGSLG